MCVYITQPYVATIWHLPTLHSSRCISLCIPRLRPLIPALVLVILAGPLDLVSNHEAVESGAAEPKLTRIRVGIRVAPVVTVCNPTLVFGVRGVELPRVEQGADGLVVVGVDEPGGDLVARLTVPVYVAAGRRERAARVHGEGPVLAVQILSRVQRGIGGLTRIEVRGPREGAARRGGQRLDFALQMPDALHACEDGCGDEARVLVGCFDEVGDFLDDVFGCSTGIFALVARRKGRPRLSAKERVVARETGFACKLLN